MSEAISVRLDDDAQRALAALEAAGASRSEAVRRSLIEAAERLRDPARLAAEVEALLADADDQREATVVAEMMDDLRAPW